MLVRFATTEEGTAKIITRFGGVVQVFLQWSGHELDGNGNVVETGATAKPFFGGLRVWPGLPIDRVYSYKLRWHSIEDKEGKRTPVFHEKEVDYVMVRPDRYWRRMERLETSDAQFPDVEWLIGLRSINPEKTIFKAPHDWVENSLTQLEPMLRSFVRSKDLNELLDLNNEKIWSELRQNRAIQVVLRQEWGVQVDEEEIGIFNIDPPKEYQEALAAETREDLLAKGRAAEIAGTFIQAVALMSGQGQDQVAAEFKADPEGFYKRHKGTMDNIMARLSMEERAYLRIDTPGAKGGVGDVLRIIGAWQRMPSGSGDRGLKKKGGKKDKRNKIDWSRIKTGADLLREVRETDEDEDEEEEEDETIQ